MIGFVDINLPYDHGQTKKVPPQSKIDLRLAYKDTYNVLTLSERFFYCQYELHICTYCQCYQSFF